jgi:hypothetical protein
VGLGGSYSREPTSAYRENLTLSLPTLSFLSLLSYCSCKDFKHRINKSEENGLVSVLRRSVLIPPICVCVCVCVCVCFVVVVVVIVVVSPSLNS